MTTLLQKYRVGGGGGGSFKTKRFGFLISLFNDSFFLEGGAKKKLAIKTIKR